MPLNADVSTALQLLEGIQQSIQTCDDPKLEAHASADLNLLISVLENPVFRGICTMQDALGELNNQIQAHPSLLPADFDLDPVGHLVLNVPPSAAGVMFEGRTFEADDQRVPVAKLSVSSSSGGDANSPQVTSPNMIGLGERMPQTPITTPTYALEFQKAIEAASLGRDVHTVQLFKPEGSSLGFSVVGLRSEERGELGIYVQEIQAPGIAGRGCTEIDGRLQEGDQILAIDGQPLDADISHLQAISILQQARGLVELVIARQRSSVLDQSSLPASITPTSPAVARSPSATSDTSKAGSDMVLNTEWAQVEVIDLVNDGSGLGFGIIGGRSTGVVVKTILPGGVADRDARLQSGDHILQIGEVNLRGMGSEQVAAVLRQSGSHVRLVVARPVEPTSPDYQALGSHAPIVPTKILGDAEELDRHLIQNGYGKAISSTSTMPSDLQFNPNLYIYNQNQNGGEIELHPQPGTLIDVVGGQLPDISIGLLGAEDSTEALPEMDVFEVELKKDAHGLGITIAGYVCEKEELSGIFVKSVSEGSAADVCSKIQVNDRIVEVDSQSLQGFNNHQAVEVLRATGQTVCLRLERYLRGPKFEQLQQAIANSEVKPPTSPNSPSFTSLPHVPLSSAGETETIIEPDGESRTTIDSMVLLESTLGLDLNTIEGIEAANNAFVALADVEKLIDQHFDGDLSPAVEDALVAKWGQLMGPDVEIVVAQLSKGEGGGLGISLEGTVDVEDGQEVRPHHYIRSILPDGPVGKNGRLKSGDELLEVNGRRLLGLNHVEVVAILKDLPLHVRMVCARKPGETAARVIDTSQDRAAFVSRSILGGSLQNLIPASDRLVKAKSDGSLASSATAGTDSNSFSRMKSRSLEPLTGLAMWSSEPQVIELVKGDRGLGFSILDYQDPMNPSETVIVIRSLVPGGVAQQDGRLIPGDRLLFVNNTSLENASLDRAVQALKGAGRGVVRIGVAKPLPLPEAAAGGASTPTSQALFLCDDDETLPDAEEQEEVEVPASNAASVTVDARSVLSSCSGDVSLGFEDQTEPAAQSPKISKQDISQAAALFTNEEVEKPDQEVPTEEPDSLNEPAQAEVPRLSPEVEPPAATPVPEPAAPESPPPAEAPAAAPELDLTPVAAVESTIRMGKAPAEPLGIAVDAEAGAFGGAVVSAVLPGGAAHRDGRLKAGAELLCVNNENLRRVSQAQTNAILRRAALQSAEVSVTFVPAPPLVEFGPSADCRPAASKAAVPPQPPSFTQQLSLISPSPPLIPPPPPPRPPPEERVPSPQQDASSAAREQPHHEHKTDQSQEQCVTVISVDHGAAPQLPLQEEAPSAPASGHQRSRSRTEIVIGGDSAPRIQNVEYASAALAAAPAEESLEQSSPDESRHTMTVTQTLQSSSSPQSNQKSGAALMAKHWGPERLVEVTKEPNCSLGISIVGGKVDLYNAGPESGSAISGIFIKNVLPESPAGKTGELKTGDRILEVDDVNLRTASHERAVEVIRAAGNPVRFLVQSLIQWSMDSENEGHDLPSTSATPLGFREKSFPPEVPMSVTPIPDLIQEGMDDLTKQGMTSSSEPTQRSSNDNQKEESAANQNAPPQSSSEKKYSSDEESDEEDTRDMEGRTTTKQGEEIMRASAGNVKRTPAEIADDPEEEDEYGYTNNKVKKKYSALPGTLVVASLERGQHGLGISLAGHKDRTRMAVFVCGLNPNGTAAKDGVLKVGDEILEVNGCVVQGRCHLNASAMIKGCAGPRFKVIALRRDTALGELAVKPITQFPVSLDDETIEEKYAKFKNLKTVTIKKGPTGLGIMIIEGKHAEVGQGIFISDLQEGSAAELAGVKVGDMILQVNKDQILGQNYDTAAKILKRAEGVVTLVVCNPKGDEPPAKKEEPPEPPADPATCPIKIGKETTIEVNKDKMGLGLSIVGGSDTLLSAIIIHEVYPDGAAAKDGRLRPGDQILEVNTEDFRSITHTKALAVLRQTPAKVKMVVLREETAKDEDRYDALDVELVKKPGKGLGLSIVGRKNGTGVFISDVVHGGTAEADGRLMKGDQILSVNGQDLKSASQEEAAAVLKTVAGKVTMKLGRLKPARKGGAANGTEKLEPEEPPLDRLTPPPIPPLPSASSIAAAAAAVPPQSPLTCREVRLARGHDGLGFSIVGGHNSPHGDLPIYVKTVFESGAAATSGAIRRGDQIVAVDNVSLEGLSHQEAVAVLKHATGPVVTLTIMP